MRPPPSQNGPPNRRLADEARLPAPQINPVLQLKEPPNPIRIHIIRHRRPAQLNRMPQNSLQRPMQPGQFFLFQSPSFASRPDPSPKQALQFLD